MKKEVKKSNISKRKFVFLIIEASLFLLLFISIFMPQLQLPDLNTQFNLVHLSSGDTGDGYHTFNVSVQLIFVITFIVLGLILSVERIFDKKHKKDLPYLVAYIIFGLIIGIFSLLKKNFISLASLNSSNVANSTLLWGTYVTAVLGFVVAIISSVDIYYSHKERLF